MNWDDIKQQIELAKTMGCKSVTIAGTVYDLGDIHKAAVPIPDNLKLEDIYKEDDPFEGLTEEEILMWSTPYGMELEEKRLKAKKHMEEQQNFKNSLDEATNDNRIV